MPKTICSTCGNPHEGTHRKTYLSRKTGQTRVYRDSRCNRCGALRRRKDRTTPHGQFIDARNIARRRDLDWELTEVEYTALRQGPCIYCGFPIPLTGMGIDRVDTSQPYSVSNAVPCCTECNVGKNANFTFDEMKLLGRVIALIKRRRQDRGQVARQFGRPRKYAD